MFSDNSIKQKDRHISLLNSQLAVSEKRLADADQKLKQLEAAKQQNEKRLNRRIKELLDETNMIQKKNVKLQNKLEKSSQIIGKLENKVLKNTSKPMASINLVVHLLKCIRKRDDHIASLTKINRMLADSNKHLLDERDDVKEELMSLLDNNPNIIDSSTFHKTSVSLKDLSQYSEQDIEQILPDQSKTVKKSANRLAKVSMEDIREAFNRYGSND